MGVKIKNDSKTKGWGKKIKKTPWVKPQFGMVVRVFSKGPGDLGSIPGRVILKTQKMVLDASLLNTQHYKVRIKGKVGAILGKE